jgi:Phosphotransferase enzyme family
MADVMPWEQAEWLEQAQDWIRAELRRMGRQASGPSVQIHVRPWSTVLRVPAGDGPLYFKACAASVRHEAALTDYLSKRRPDCMLVVHGLERERGWMLVQDGGTTLRSRAHDRAYLGLWEGALRRYAEVQQELAGQTQELLRLGTPDRRLAGLADQLAEMLDKKAVQRSGGRQGLSRENYRRLQKLLPGFDRACRRLADFGIPESLHHDDLHDANIFVEGGQSRFADWGESCVTHPFFSLLVSLRSAAYQCGLAEEAKPIEGLQEAYLGAWQGHAPMEALKKAAMLATRLAMANRALTWQRVTRDIPQPARGDYESAAPGWLEELLEAEQRQPMLV